LTFACISLMLAGMFTLQSSAAIDPTTIAGMWLFDEGQGETAKDSSGNGNDGALMGGPVWVAGKIGGALQFDGSDDYVDCGADPSLDLTEQLTLAAWMKHPPGTEGYTIIRNTEDDGIRQYSLLDYVSSGVTSIYCDTPNGRENLDWPLTLDDDTWHHAAMVIDNINVELFVDGVGQGVQQLSDTLVSVDTTVWIGRRKPANFAFTGLIDEVAVFSVPLSESDIQTIMAGLSGAVSAVSPSGKLAASWATIKTQH